MGLSHRRRDSTADPRPPSWWPGVPIALVCVGKELAASAGTKALTLKSQKAEEGWGRHGI